MKYLCFLFLLFIVGCKDNHFTIVQLPPITSEGLNTFGCLVNGESWVAQVHNNIDDKLNINYNPYYDELQLRASKVTSSTDERFSFAIIDLSGVGEYQIHYLEDEFYDWKNNRAFSMDTTKIRRLTLDKFDADNNIASGTFEFTVFRQTDTLKVTEGRFDVKF